MLEKEIRRNLGIDFASVISKEALWNPLSLTVLGVLLLKFTDVKCYENSVFLLQRIVEMPCTGTLPKTVKSRKRGEEKSMPARRGKEVLFSLQKG